MTSIATSYEMYEALYKIALQLWQYEWDNSSKGLWTKHLIETASENEVPNISKWMSQALSGHGVFGKYLHRFMGRATAVCQCGSPTESPTHIFTECSNFAVGRPPVLNIGEGHTRNYLIRTV